MSQVVALAMGGPWGCGLLTNNDQRIPLPPAGIAGAGNSAVQLGVGLRHIAVCLLGALLNLRNGRLLLVHQLRNLLVQLTESDHVLLDLADRGGSLHSRLASIVGLAGSGSGGLNSVSTSVDCIDDTSGLVDVMRRGEGLP